MDKLPDWLEPLARLEDFEGDSATYINHLYDIFHRDFVFAKPTFQNKDVIFDNALEDGKPRAFTHITTENERTTGERVLALRRCERIGWIKAIIEHHDDPAVLYWEKEHFTPRKKANRLYFFLECDDFLVILEEMKNGHLMITAIYVDNTNQKEKHLKAHAQYQEKQIP